MEVVMVYTVFPDMDCARRVVKELFERKLIAYANLREHEAIYSDGSGLHEVREVGALIKTDVGRWKELRDAIRELHPHDVPMIVRIDVDRVNREYAEWMEMVLQ